MTLLAKLVRNKKNVNNCKREIFKLQKYTRKKF